MSTHRILTIAHGHPDFSKGGGEIAAYNLHKAYAARDDVEEAVFLGRADRGRGPSGRIVRRRDNEFLWEQATHDVFLMKAANQFELHGYFKEFIRSIRPTVVHMHHYVHMGLEIIRMIKQVDPSIRIVLTLHEYFAICANEGQMVKRHTRQLCYVSGFDDCSRCLGDKTPEDIWLRKHRFMNYFDMVDAFVAPSEFLRQRYIDWGLAAEDITVIENGQQSLDPLPPRALPEDGTRNRFAFFGQINSFKGVDLLLEAMLAIPRKERKNLVLEIHGANLEHQPEEFRNKVNALREQLEEERVIRWVGPYDPNQMLSRLANVDWVIVPSIWWENSPMVIQEALSAGRPVIVSDIGGMAEKVIDGVNGRHVPARNVFAWASTLRELAHNSEQWEKMRNGIVPPLSYAECAEAHMPLLS